MARRIIEKTHNPQCLAFDGSPFEKVMVSSLAISQTHDQVQDYVGLSSACKIPLVGLFVLAGGNGITAMNICIKGGVIPATGLTVPDNSDTIGAPPAVNTTGGLCLFQGATGPVDQPVSLSQNYSGAVYPTSEPDAIFPQGTILSLRLVTGAATVGFARAVLLCIPVDIRRGYTGLWTWGNANVG